MQILTSIFNNEETNVGKMVRTFIKTKLDVQELTIKVLDHYCKIEPEDPVLKHMNLLRVDGELSCILNFVPFIVVSADTFAHLYYNDDDVVIKFELQ